MDPPMLIRWHNTYDNPHKRHKALVPHVIDQLVDRY